MKTSTRLLCISCTVLFLICLTIPADSSAAPSKSFDEWLRQYGAWDQLDKEFARKGMNNSPETIVKRATVYLNLNSPEKALEIIEMNPAFENKSLEAKRLWLGGQAHRSLGNLTKAVLWFTQSAEQLNDPKSVIKTFKDEEGLQYIWMDVWMKMYWAYGNKHYLSQQVQQSTLQRIAHVGALVWKSEYWDQAKEILDTTPTKDKNKTSQADTPNQYQPMISETDKEHITKAFGLISLEKFDEALTEVSKLEQSPARFFWTTLFKTIESGQMPEDLTPLKEGNYLKAYAFWKGSIASLTTQGPSIWVLGNPDSTPWTQFRNKLLGMHVDDAIVAIDKELGSMLISKQTSKLLNSFKLALTLSNGDFSLASLTWESIEKNDLPLSLIFAGTLFFNKDFNSSLPENISENTEIRTVFSMLAKSTGYKTLENEAPFWVVSPDDKLKTLSEETYPMDKLLLLAYWEKRFNEDPNLLLAKRAAYLFNNTSFGTQATLYLAAKAVEAKDLQLAAYYLNRIDHQVLHSKQKMEWFDVKLKIELDSGHNERALRTYTQMRELQTDIPIMSVLRMSLLYQQLRNFDAARVQLLSLWDKKDSLPSSLQAETLFWLGEGEQGLKNAEKALDYYLLLAWKYPQENIWALTAMYRASLIYEKRGKYETAKRLLTTVVKRADRKEQREAAKARINAIDKKMGSISDNKSTMLKYPF